LSIQQTLKPRTANNFLKAKSIFNSRRNYHSDHSSLLSQGVSTLDAKLLYGKVDRDLNPVLLNTKFLVPFETNKALVGFGPVVDAFEQMRRYFQKQIATSAVLLGASHMPHLRLMPVSSYVGYESEYIQHINRLYTVLIKYFKRHALMGEVEKFSDFVEHFTSFFLKTGSEFPITRAGFLMSRFCSAHVSGLMIDLHGHPISEDSHKYEHTSHPTFEFYKNSAKKFGFLIDANKPTRLVFNLNSPVSLKFINQYSITGPPIYVGSSSEIAQNLDGAGPSGHRHSIRYRMFGDNAGRGYTSDIIDGDAVIASSDPKVHVHRIKNYSEIKKQKIKSSVGGLEHYHEIKKFKKEEVFGHFFNKAIFSDIDGDASSPGIRRVIFSLYKRFLGDYPYIKEFKYLGKKCTSKWGSEINDLPMKYVVQQPADEKSALIQKNRKRKQLLDSDFESKYGFYYFLPVYIKLRFLEVGMPFDENKINKIAKKTKTYMLVQDYHTSMNEMEYLIDSAMLEYDMEQELDRLGFRS
jgi:hypothetical protein